MSDLNEHMIRKIWNVYTDTGEWPEFLDAVKTILVKEKKQLQDFIKTEADWLEEQGFGTDAERFRAKGGES